MFQNTPLENGFTFPAEWEAHRATWLSFPKNAETWEDRLPRVYPAYMQFIKQISASELVCINAQDDSLMGQIRELLRTYDIAEDRVQLYPIPTNDSWCRDHGPAFLLNRSSAQKMIVNWEYNAWGGKYPPYNDDNDVPIRVADTLGLPYVSPGIVMEGGSIEVNGKGALLTSESCLLHPNRNPGLDKKTIELYLMNYYGVEQILWVKDGIVGDDTDGHIDDTTRFVNETTVLTCVEHRQSDANYTPLKENLALLQKMQLLNGKSLEIIELPMPNPVFSAGIRLPASYANFYITNGHVIVPTYRSPQDDTALEIIRKAFPTRSVVGIDSTEIIWGLGSFHCLSQQEPLL